MSNARNISKAESRFVNATGDTISGEVQDGTYVGLNVNNHHQYIAGQYGKTRLQFTMTEPGQVAEDRIQGFIETGNAQDTSSADAFMNIGSRWNGGEVTAFAISGKANIATPNQPAFIASGPGQYETWANNTDIVFNQVQNNTGNHYNGSNGRFTAPVSGYYLFGVHLFDNSGSADRLALFRNGSQIGAPYMGNMVGSSVTQPISGHQILYCTAGDYITVRTVYYSHEYYMGHSGFTGRFLG